MTGVYNLKPPIPKHSHLWDPCTYFLYENIFIWLVLCVTSQTAMLCLLEPLVPIWWLVILRLVFGSNRAYRNQMAWVRLYSTAIGLWIFIFWSGLFQIFLFRSVTTVGITRGITLSLIISKIIVIPEAELSAARVWRLRSMPPTAKSFCLFFSLRSMPIQGVNNVYS